ncbi:receptor-type tyrosine-protein phosphatase alpha-like [Physella acuta]|uniref:receptor-type tyrosine-protein phosphatase alpha-like n=1 Tax=Physella acuta TaxID=109671 RepID=UPI0027DAEE68|nr:receptor-type tyrosine-protein phosphatase alpha-like [Physella acuta]
MSYSVCPIGYFGLDCTGRCNCETDQKCFVATGGCRSGCATGYQGQGCSEDCHSGTWGIDCLQTCGTRCKNQNCHRSNGTCLDGCVDGYLGLTCSEECRPNKFGPECIFSCPTNCTDSRCNSTTGFCLLCKPGKIGNFCNQECDDGLYGQNCSNNCSTLCESRLCHPVSGGCYNCVQGTSCVLESAGETSSTAAIVPVVTLLIVSLVLVVLIIVWKRRRGSINRKQIHEKKTFYKSNSDEVLTDENKDRSERVSKELHDVNQHAYTNVAEEIENTAIEINHLRGYLQDHDSIFLKEQFQRIPQPVGVSMLVGLDERNIKKNRYKNICAYDHSRVHLNVNSDQQDSDYINASYVQGYGGKEKFIAAQGPTSVTVNDFVRMLWEQRVDTVVMLTNLTEEGKIKCVQYWPEEDAVEFNGIEVSLAVTRVFADYTIRKLELNQSGSPSHTLTHYHYTSWPDKGVPTTPWSLVDFEQRVAAGVTSVPIVVHCSAGVGRTGTFIALRNLMREAEATGRFDFFQTVLKLRQDRVLLVQTAEQYELLHKAVLVASVCMGRTISSTCITQRLAALEKRNLTGKTGIEAEFDSVCEVVAQLSNKSTDDENNVYENNFVSNYSKDGIIFNIFFKTLSKVINLYSSVL